jgi:hypothetical protein
MAYGVGQDGLIHNDTFDHASTILKTGPRKQDAAALCMELSGEEFAADLAWIRATQFAEGVYDDFHLGDFYVTQSEHGLHVVRTAPEIFGQQRLTPYMQAWLGRINLANVELSETLPAHFRGLMQLMPEPLNER